MVHDKGSVIREMTSGFERGENTAKRTERDFGLVTPWLCASLVVGVEAFHKSFALAVFIAIASLSLTVVILAGASLWNGTKAPNDRALSTRSNQSRLHRMSDDPTFLATTKSTKSTLRAGTAAPTRIT